MDLHMINEERVAPKAYQSRIWFKGTRASKCTHASASPMHQRHPCISVTHALPMHQRHPCLTPASACTHAHACTYATACTHPCKRMHPCTIGAWVIRWGTMPIAWAWAVARGTHLHTLTGTHAHMFARTWCTCRGHTASQRAESARRARAAGRLARCRVAARTPHTRTTLARGGARSRPRRRPSRRPTMAPATAWALPRPVACRACVRTAAAAMRMAGRAASATSAVRGWWRRCGRARATWLVSETRCVTSSRPRASRSGELVAGGSGCLPVDLLLHMHNVTATPIAIATATVTV
eukprot:357088-Chlamydomonas_euryale.AAC.1